MTARLSGRLVRTDGRPVRALVVDDEPALCDILALGLRYEGWKVMTVMTGQDAVRTARAFDPDVIVLDVMLPDLDGHSVLRRIRESGNRVPVLFLTARDALEDRVTGLDAGGDDYVTKPFDLDEVVVRLRGLLRRTAPVVDERTGSTLEIDDLVLDEETFEVSRGGVTIDLSPTEFELLRFLMLHPRRVHDKLHILREVWKYDYGGRPSIVDLYISYLRRKLDAHGPPLIHTVRGVGYLLRPATEPE